MEKNNEQALKCNGKGRRVSENLCECISDGHEYCEHRFSFGYAYYCSLLLKDGTDRPDHKKP